MDILSGWCISVVPDYPRIFNLPIWLRAGPLTWGFPRPHSVLKCHFWFSGENWKFRVLLFGLSSHSEAWTPLVGLGGWYACKNPQVCFLMDFSICWGSENGTPADTKAQLYTMPCIFKSLCSVGLTPLEDCSLNYLSVWNLLFCSSYLRNTFSNSTPPPHMTAMNLSSITHTLLGILLASWFTVKGDQ